MNLEFTSQHTLRKNPLIFSRMLFPTLIHPGNIHLPFTIHFKGYFLSEAALDSPPEGLVRLASGSKNSWNCHNFDIGLAIFITDCLYICSFPTLLMSSRGNGLHLNHLCISSSQHWKHSANVLCWMKGLSSAGSTPGSHIPSPLGHCGPLFLVLRHENTKLHSLLVFSSLLILLKSQLQLVPNGKLS